MQGYPYSERRNLFLCLHVDMSSVHEFNVLSLLAVSIQHFSHRHRHRRALLLHFMPRPIRFFVNKMFKPNYGSSHHFPLSRRSRQIPSSFLSCGALALLSHMKNTPAACAAVYFLSQTLAVLPHIPAGLSPCCPSRRRCTRWLCWLL